MSSPSKRSIYKTIFLVVGTGAVSGLIIFSFLMVGKASSRLITSPIFHPSSW